MKLLPYVRYPLEMVGGLVIMSGDRGRLTPLHLPSHGHGVATGDLRSRIWP